MRTYCIMRGEGTNDVLGGVMKTAAEPICELSKKIAKICQHLRPYQALEYDPGLGIVLITTEWSISINEMDKVGEILAHRQADEKITVRRFGTHYKISLVKSLAV